MTRSHQQYALSLVILAFALFVTQSAHSIYSKKSELPAAYSILTKLANGSGVAYFGDSIISYYYPCDPEKGSIPQYLTDILKRNVLSIDGAGYSPILFRKAAKAVNLVGNGIDVAVVSLNLRSFSRDWADNPAYHFYDIQVFLDLFTGNAPLTDIYHSLRREKRDVLARKWERTIVSLGKFGDMSVARAREIIRSVPQDDCGKVLRVNEERLQLAYQFYYGGRIGLDHPMLQHIKELAENLRRKNVDVRFYVTPLDLGRIRETDVDAYRAIGHNLAVITEAARRNAWKLLDLSGLLTRDHFFQINEHLNEAGRQRVAEKLAAWMAATNID